MKNKRWYLLPLLSLSLAALACNALSPDATPTFDPGAEATPITAETNTPVPDVTAAAPTETAPAAASETPAALATETPTADQAFIAYVLDGQLMVTDISGG